MNEKILVGVAWPYANSPLHLGHLAGAYVPPDIFARYHRMRGDNVLMVSGSDTHGTPITVSAEQQGVEPVDIIEKYHASFCESLMGMGVSFDLFTHTHTENHRAVTVDFFETLLEKGYIYKEAMTALYCEDCARFLPDRYVEGTCPHCGFEDARGDQCDNCGKPLDALELINPRCKFCEGTPVARETEHFFLDLAKFNDPLKDWVGDKEHWRANVRNFTYNLLNEGLRGRAISRDMSWGIPIPVDGYEHKCIYVWFDAVIGYLSASKEWSVAQGEPDAWHAWWDKDGDARSYYFIGKDNIVFHTLIWPSILMGYGGLKLPYDVPANEYLTLEGRKLSSSRNWAVWAPDYLERYAADPLRYCLTIHAPEGSDSDFSWQDFLDRNNNELVGTWGNLAHRMLSFAAKNFGSVPTPGELLPEDKEIIHLVEETFEPVAQDIEACRFRVALMKVMAAARKANQYLDVTAPWKSLKTDRERAATATYVALRVIDSLKVLFAPFLPFSSQQLHEAFGYETNLMGTQELVTHKESDDQSHLALVYNYDFEGDLWKPSELSSGGELTRPKPLFAKLDPEIVEEELARLGK